MRGGTRALRAVSVDAPSARYLQNYSQDTDHTSSYFVFLSASDTETDSFLHLGSQGDPEGVSGRHAGISSSAPALRKPHFSQRNRSTAQQTSLPSDPLAERSNSPFDTY